MPPLSVLAAALPFISLLACNGIVWSLERIGVKEKDARQTAELLVSLAIPTALFVFASLT